MPKVKQGRLALVASRLGIYAQWWARLAARQSIERECRGFGPVASADLGVDVSDMALHRPFAEHEFGGDFPAGLPQGDQPQHLDLPFRKTCGVRRWR